MPVVLTDVVCTAIGNLDTLDYFVRSIEFSYMRRQDREVVCGCANEYKGGGKK